MKCQDLVIGSGAGGSVAARELALRGRDVLVLEEGDAAPPFTSDVGGMMRSLYRDGGICPFWGRPPVGFAEARCLGGGTVINGGLVWRTPEWILDEWALPGYSMRELTPHFETVERLLHVTLPTPQVEGNRDSAALVRGSRQLGWKCVRVPRALRGCRNSNLCTTGCPTGAKQATPETYLAEARAHGARLATGQRVTRLGPRKAVANGQEIAFDRVWLACGALQTPYLLRRSGLAPQAGRGLAFHLNLKVVALFDEELDAERGTIFTDQVQEFEREGVLLMASNLRSQFLTSTLAHYPPEVLREVLAERRRCGLFVAVVRPRAQGRVHTWLPGYPLVTHGLGAPDQRLLAYAYEKMAELLFASGATRIFPPLKGAQPARSLLDVRRQCSTLRLGDLELISVHAMSSCRMGQQRAHSVVDPEGRLWGHGNVYLADASILPSSTGESPQGTIMALAHEVLLRHLG